MILCCSYSILSLLLFSLSFYINLFYFELFLIFIFISLRFLNNLISLFSCKYFYIQSPVHLHSLFLLCHIYVGLYDNLKNLYRVIRGYICFVIINKSNRNVIYFRIIYIKKFNYTKFSCRLASRTSNE